MTDHKLRFALVGLGFSRHVLAAYTSAAEVELAILCDIDGDKAAAISREHGVPYTTRFEDCLGSGIDAVDISTPNHLHAAQATAALRAGKHVLLQKPMARTAAECAEIVAAGRTAGRTVGVFMSSLNRPVLHELRAMIAAGAFGELTLLRGITAHRSSHVHWEKWGRGPDYWRRNKELTGGGAMALIGIHLINLLPWLAGRPVESVAAFSGNVASREIMQGDDITAAVCRLRSGGLVAIEAGYATEGDALGIHGTTGRAELRAGELRVKLDQPWEGRVLDVAGGEQEAIFDADEIQRRGAPFVAECEQHAAFARAVLAGEAPPVTGDTGMRDVAVLEAIYRSAESGRHETPAADG